ncbi:MAG: hypothetical protein ACNI27_08020 [Desulfovibrio sp.]
MKDFMKQPYRFDKQFKQMQKNFSERLAVEVQQNNRTFLIFYVCVGLVLAFILYLNASSVMKLYPALSMSPSETHPAPLLEYFKLSFYGACALIGYGGICLYGYARRLSFFRYALVGYFVLRAMLEYGLLFWSYNSGVFQALGPVHQKQLLVGLGGVTILLMVIAPVIYSSKPLQVMFNK